ncbi:MAG: hypothetical protein ING31_07985 [Burkholderiales bacterium]|nr:hypothetical protein [Burkholderiales bacterium]
MKRTLLPAAAIASVWMLAQPVLAPSALAAGPNCGRPIGYESRQGHFCVGRWVQRSTGATMKCRDGAVMRHQRYFCTQWRPSGGVLINPNNPNPPISNPRPRGSGPPPPAPKLN